MILFYDTETTGITNFRLPVDHPSQPHIVQLGALLCLDDAECTVVKQYSAIVKPDGWYVQTDAQNVHGISTDYAFKFGEPIRGVMTHFAALFVGVERLIGHNIEFDIRMALREVYCLDDFDASFISAPLPFCTMRSMTPICRLQHPRNPRGFKWPKLIEAYRFMFDRDFDNAHTALGDVYACRDIFVEGRRRGWWLADR